MLGDFLNLERFHKRSLTSPRLYTVAVQTPTGTALFGKRMAYLKISSTVGKVCSPPFGMVRPFSDLETSVATCSMTVDWVLWDGMLYVLDAKNLHAEFAITRRSGKLSLITWTPYVRRSQSKAPINLLCDVSPACRWPANSSTSWKQASGVNRSALSRSTRSSAASTWSGIRTNSCSMARLSGSSPFSKLLAEDRTHGPVSGYL